MTRVVGTKFQAVERGQAFHSAKRIEPIAIPAEDGVAQQAECAMQGVLRSFFECRELTSFLSTDRIIWKHRRYNDF